MSRLDRRGFLRGSFTLAFTTLTASARPSWSMDPIPRTRPSHLKLSLAAYSYRQFLSGEKPEMTLFDFADLAADMKLDAIEPTSYYFPAEVDPAYLHRLQRHAFLLGLDISGTAIRNDFCLPPGKERDRELAHTRRWIEFAAELKAPVIRCFAGNVPKGDLEDEAVARTIAAYHEVLPHAEQHGVMLALENHGGITASREQMLRLVRAIDHPCFGVNLDTGNFRTEDPYEDLAALVPYAINVQVKTEISRAGAKKEEADLGRLVQILKDARYSGYVVLEYEAAEDPRTAIPRYVESLRGLLS